MSGWTHEEAKKHTLIERLLERCATYGPGTCPSRGLDYDDWCERCLAADALGHVWNKAMCHPYPLCACGAEQREDEE